MSGKAFSIAAATLIVASVLCAPCKAVSRVRVDGYSIAMASFSGGGKAMFVKDRDWFYSKSGGGSLTLTVKRRDEWSVYFTGGGASWQLDYWTKQMKRNGLKVETVSSGEVGDITGRNLGRVTFVRGGTRGTIIPNSSASGTVRLGRESVSMVYNGRDEWSVYLKSGRSGFKNVQADVWTRKVIITTSNGSKTKYDIVQTNYMNSPYSVF